jgi:hypothetical protein
MTRRAYNNTWNSDCSTCRRRWEGQQCNGTNKVTQDWRTIIIGSVIVVASLEETPILQDHSSWLSNFKVVYCFFGIVATVMLNHSCSIKGSATPDFEVLS